MHNESIPSPSNFIEVSVLICVICLTPPESSVSVHSVKVKIVMNNLRWGKINK